MHKGTSHVYACRGLVTHHAFINHSASEEDDASAACEVSAILYSLVYCIRKGLAK